MTYYVLNLSNSHNFSSISSNFANSIIYLTYLFSSDYSISSLCSISSVNLSINSFYFNNAFKSSIKSISSISLSYKPIYVKLISSRSKTFINSNIALSVKWLFHNYNVFKYFKLGHNIYAAESENPVLPKFNSSKHLFFFKH